MSNFQWHCLDAMVGMIFQFKARLFDHKIEQTLKSAEDRKRRNGLSNKNGAVDKFTVVFLCMIDDLPTISKVKLLLCFTAQLAHAMTNAQKTQNKKRTS